MKLHDFLTEYGAMVQLDKLWSKPVGSQQHLLKNPKRKRKQKPKKHQRAHTSQSQAI